MVAPDKSSLESYALRILPEAQVRKFRYRPDLLTQELESESAFPEISNVLSDIFTAVKDKNYQKFLIAHRQLNGRIDEETLTQAIRHSIVSKTEEPCGKCEKCRSGKRQECQHKKLAIVTKREAYVLSKLSKGASLLEVF